MFYCLTIYVVPAENMFAHFFLIFYFTIKLVFKHTNLLST